MDDAALKSVIASIKTMSPAQRQEVWSALRDSEATTTHDIGDENECYDGPCGDAPLLAAAGDRSVVDNIGTSAETSRKLSWFRRFILNHIVSDLPGTLAPCEYCGRRTRKPEGCENMGTERAHRCPYAHD